MLNTIFNRSAIVAGFVSVSAWAGEKVDMITISPFTHYAAGVGLVILIISAMDKALDLCVKFNTFRKNSNDSTME